MMTTYSVTHRVLPWLQFLLVAAWSSNQVLSSLLSPLILFFFPLAPAGAGLVSPRPRSLVSVPPHLLPSSCVGFCPFPTHVSVEGMCWAPMVIENCLL